MGDMLDKILKSILVTDSTLLSSTIPTRSVASSRPTSAGSSSVSNPQQDEPDG